MLYFVLFKILIRTTATKTKLTKETIGFDKKTAHKQNREVFMWWIVFNLFIQLKNQIASANNFFLFQFYIF